MRKGATQAANHPKKGSSIKVEPIRDLAAIGRIKQVLKDQPRNLCLFTLGINTAYRANELLSLRIRQVQHLRCGDRLDLKQSKNRRYRATTLNRPVIETLQGWLDAHPRPQPDMPVFLSRSRPCALSVSTLNRLVKLWCHDAGLSGNYGSHTLRKSWGYHQRMMNGAPVALLMRAFGHSSEQQTLDYLCIQAEEIDELYDMEL